MAWEKRGERTYFYSSIRQEGRVKKVYYGAGPAGKLAAGADALRRAEEGALRAAADRLTAAVALTRDLNRACELLTAASLLAAGYHRPGRHFWRGWRYGRRVLNDGPAGADRDPGAERPGAAGPGGGRDCPASHP